MTAEKPTVYSIDHFREALRELGDLHRDDLSEIPTLSIAARLYVTAGVAIRFASREAGRPWRAWRLDSFVADGTDQDQLGGDFTAARMMISSRGGREIQIDYEDGARSGYVRLDGEILFSWCD